MADHPLPVQTPPTDARTLSTLRRKESGHVQRLTLPAAQAGRLAGLGICEGRLIEVISRGDPMIVRVCGSTLGLGKPIAAGIEVCVCESPGCDEVPGFERPAGVQEAEGGAP